MRKIHKEYPVRVQLVVFAASVLSLMNTGVSFCADDEPATKEKVIEFYEKEVRPLLSRRCYSCHSTVGKQQGALRLDSPAGWNQGGDSGPAIKPGYPEQSLLIKAIRYQDENVQMPPSGKLSPREIEILTRWVKLGALGPTEGAVDVQNEMRLRHWAFQSVQRPALPGVKDETWCRGSIDRFIRFRQEQDGIDPVGDADRLSLVRRATFDLIGVPPSPDEVDAFLQDAAPSAFERLVERLLKSPHFGERWGRHWLDVARYAESGGENNLFYVDAWRYRDYVIAAFNQDKPYDRFIIEQLAGDLLPALTPQAGDEQTIATGFLALGQYDQGKFDEGAVLEQIDEQIDVTTKAMLATTVSCARCHDHKFDPIPTTDYYALAGIFRSTAILKTAVFTKGKHTLVRVAVGAPLQGYQQKPFDEFSQLQADLYGGRHEVTRMGWSFNKLLAAAKDAREPLERETLQSQAAKLKQEMATRVLASKRAEEQLASFPPLPPTALSVADRKSPRDETVRIRGEVDHLGATVKRGFIKVLSVKEAESIPPESSGRLELARWIASRDNPVTARVMVNRVWQHLFGAGLVTSVDNFGVSGELPSHPELLDYLAQQFMDEGWSIKKLIRKIMLSRTYQLSVARNSAAENVDADNRLLWRMNRRRLEAEVIRDSMLSFSGQLDLTPGNRSQVAAIGVKAMRYDADQISFESTTRSIYLPQPRGRTPEVLALFDVADKLVTVGQRDVTTIPPQALFLLNSQFARQQARSAASRLLAEHHLTERARIDRAFRFAVSRPATTEDLAIAHRFFENFAMATKASKRELPPPTQTTKATGKKSQKVPQFEKAAENDSIGTDSLQLQGWTAFCQLLMASSEFRYLP